MRLDQIMSRLFDFDATSYYNWKKQGRIIIKFLNNYFTKEELREIIESDGMLEKLEVIRHKSLADLKNDTSFYQIENNIQSILGKYKLQDMEIILCVISIIDCHSPKDIKAFFKVFALKIDKKLLQIYNSHSNSFLDACNLTYADLEEVKKRTLNSIDKYFTKEDINLTLDYFYYFKRELLYINRHKLK